MSVTGEGTKIRCNYLRGLELQPLPRVKVSVALLHLETELFETDVFRYIP